MRRLANSHVFVRRRSGWSQSTTQPISRAAALLAAERATRLGMVKEARVETVGFPPITYASLFQGEKECFPKNG